MVEDRPADPYAVLGIGPAASQREITLAYRSRVRALHPDTPGGDAEQLAAVVAAYRLLRDPARRAAHDRDHPRTPGPQRGTRVPVRVHTSPRSIPAREPDLRAGPVRHHPNPGHSH